MSEASAERGLGCSEQRLRFSHAAPQPSKRLDTYVETGKVQNRFEAARKAPDQMLPEQNAATRGEPG